MGSKIIILIFFSFLIVVKAKSQIVYYPNTSNLEKKYGIKETRKFEIRNSNFDNVDSSLMSILMYNKNGNLSETRFYGGANNYQSKTVHLYSQDTLKKIIIYGAENNDKPISVSSFFYNDAKRNVIVSQYSGTELSSEKRYKYDKSGRLQCIEYWDIDTEHKELVRIEQYEYTKENGVRMTSKEYTESTIILNSDKSGLLQLRKWCNRVSKECEEFLQKTMDDLIQMNVRFLKDEVITTYYFYNKRLLSQTRTFSNKGVEISVHNFYYEFW